MDQISYESAPSNNHLLFSGCGGMGGVEREVRSMDRKRARSMVHEDQGRRSPLKKGDLIIATGGHLYLFVARKSGHSKLFFGLCLFVPAEFVDHKHWLGQKIQLGLDHAWIVIPPGKKLNNIRGFNPSFLS
jgi:hypothetical protein